MEIIVPPCGPRPNSVMIIGEGPGEVEAYTKRPFQGPSGEENDRFLRRFCGIGSNQVRMCNLVWDYIEDNPNPTKERIERWLPEVLHEVKLCNPKIVMLVGAFAIRTFLGDNADPFMVYGVPHRPGAFDPTISDRLPQGCVVIPTLHLAFGLRKENIRTLVMYAYSQLGQALNYLRAGKEIPIPYDEFIGREYYRIVTGEEMADTLVSARPTVIALDTEGLAPNPDYLQISLRPGHGIAIDLQETTATQALKVLQELADTRQKLCRCEFAHTCECGVRFVLHYAIHDMIVCRSVRLELEKANIYDTMYGAYVQRFEPQGLKPLSYRHFGRILNDYESVVKPLTKKMQIEYLSRAALMSWDRDPILDSPRSHTIDRRAKNIMADVAAGKVTKKGPTDPEERISDWPDHLKDSLFRVMGALPQASLRDVLNIDYNLARDYMCADPDFTMREYLYQIRVLGEPLYRLVMRGMASLPYFMNQQYNGMPVYRPFFEALYEDIKTQVKEIEEELSQNYFNGKPVKVFGRYDTLDLLDIEGLTSEKLTKTGKWSTSKPAIEHHKYSNDAFARLFDGRELDHLGGQFVKPILDRTQPGDTYTFVHPEVQYTRTHGRRTSNKNPNLLNIPTRYEVGKKLRHGYRFDPDNDEVLSSHDLAAIEMTVMATLSREPLLIELFLDPTRDFHKETAARMFQVQLADVTDDQRKAAKTTGYGIINGQSEYGLLEQFRMKGLLQYDVDQCAEFIEFWFDVYHYVKEYMSRVSHDAAKTGVVYDFWGMPRYLPGLWDKKYSVVREYRRYAVSQVIQGTAQGLIQNAQAWLVRRLWELRDAGIYVKERLQVHDSVELSFMERDWPIIDFIVREALTKHHQFPSLTPIRAEGKYSKVWGELKD